MRLTVLLILMNLVISMKCYGQKVTIDSIAQKYSADIDTSFIHSDGSWSLRTFLINKNQRFNIRSNGNQIKYSPTPHLGIGLGVNYSFLLLDIAASIGNKENSTDQFDLQGELIFKKHYASIILQSYKGFNVSSGNQTQFRDDIRSSAINLNYLYLLNSTKFSLGSTIKGTSIQKKSAGSFVLGSFIQAHNVRAPSDIIPKNNPAYSKLNGLTSYSLVGGGGTIGYAHVFVLSKRFFIFLSATTGLGLSTKTLVYNQQKTFDNSYWLFNLNYRFSFGYHHEKFYIIVNGGEGLLFSSIDNNYFTNLNQGKFKLVFGLKFHKN